MSFAGTVLSETASLSLEDHRPVRSVATKVRVAATSADEALTLAGANPAAAAPGNFPGRLSRATATRLRVRGEQIYEVEMEWSTKAPTTEQIQKEEQRRSRRERFLERKDRQEEEEERIAEEQQQQNGGLTGGTEIDPTELAPQIECDGEIKAIATYQDVDGKTILNTAGDPFFDPAPEKELSIPRVSIVSFSRTFSISEWWPVANCINSDGFLGAQPKQLKLDFPRSTRVVDKKWGIYWRIGVSIAFNPDGWQEELLSQGFRERKEYGLTGLFDYPPILDKAGREVTSPRCLDEHGKAIDPEALRADPSLAKYVTFKKYREISFSSLF
jgi:hypothetical protein